MSLRRPLSPVLPTQVPPNIFRLVRPLLVPEQPAVRRAVLYLQRPYPVLHRSLLPDNEEALLQAIRRTLRPGYHLELFSSSGDWRQDRTIFAGAAAVLGPHGGAFSNVS